MISGKKYWNPSKQWNLVDSKAETPIHWASDAKNWLIWKDPDVGNDWRQEKETTEDEMVGWQLTQWTWVWVSSGSWWWTGRPGVLRFMGPQRVGHDWATERTDDQEHHLIEDRNSNFQGNIPYIAYVLASVKAFYFGFLSFFLQLYPFVELSLRSH